MGALAGMIAAAGANALGALLASRVLNLGYGFNGTVWAIGFFCGTTGIAIAGYFGTRRALNVAPLQALRHIG